VSAPIDEWIEQARRNEHLHALRILSRGVRARSVTVGERWFLLVTRA
jgi:hypothetical protein